MWTNFEKFGAIDLQNPNKELAGSWSTRRKQLREISKNPPVALVQALRKKNFGTPTEHVDEI